MAAETANQRVPRHARGGEKRVNLVRCAEKPAESHPTWGYWVSLACLSPSYHPSVEVPGALLKPMQSSMRKVQQCFQNDPHGVSPASSPGA